MRRKCFLCGRRKECRDQDGRPVCKSCIPDFTGDLPSVVDPREAERLHRFSNMYGRVEVCTELRDTKEGHNFSDSVYLGEVEVPGNHLRSVKARG